MSSTARDQAAARSSKIRAELDHPVIDGDGHWLFPTPVFYDYLEDVAGSGMVDKVRGMGSRASAGNRAEATRGASLFAAPVRWISVNEARDWATAQLPALLYDRLDEFGIDVAFVYPTAPGMYLPEADVRLPYIRAYNVMTAELFAPYSDRIIPVAILPSHTPTELMDEAAFVTRELGFRASVMNGNIRRPAGPGADPKGTLTSGQASYIDSLALDSPYDYEPVWSKFEELGMAVTTHGGSLGWENRRSPSNYSMNHIGHFAQANQTFARSLLLAGVPLRHPRLRFLFLEGGVGWAANLLVDLIGHWAKRSREVMLTRFAPTGLDKEDVRALVRKYGRTTYGEHLDEMCADDMLSALRPHSTLEELTEEVSEFDFDRLQVTAPGELREMFSRSFAFGCEADDPMTKLAFDLSLTGVTLRAVMGSDIGHWDVMDMSQILAEAYELVEDGLIDASAFRQFVYGNAVAVHTAMNPNLFDGTIIADVVRSELSGA